MIPSIPSTSQLFLRLASCSETKKRKLNSLDGPLVQAEKILQIYKNNLYFHGTDAASAQEISKHGMDVKRKKALGNTEILSRSFGLNDRNASKHHYIQKTATEAAEYAKGFQNPTILCLILPPTIFHLQIDPEGDSSTAFMVAQKIQDKYILPLESKSLNTAQLNFLNKRLDIPEQDYAMLGVLKALVQREILIDRTETIQAASSYLEQEKRRDEITKEFLRKQGIDFSNLKEGDCISVPML